MDLAPTWLLLRFWSCRLDLRRRVEVSEILGEAVAQFLGSLIVGGFIGPGIPRIQYVGRYAVAGLGNAETKCRLDLEFFARRVA